MYKWMRKILKEDEFKSGYEWANSYISEGKLDEVEGLTYDVNDPFDRGAQKAIREYNLKKKYSKRSSLDPLI